MCIRDRSLRGLLPYNLVGVACRRSGEVDTNARIFARPTALPRARSHSLHSRRHYNKSHPSAPNQKLDFLLDRTVLRTHSHSDGRTRDHSAPLDGCPAGDTPWAHFRVGIGSITSSRGVPVSARLAKTLRAPRY